MKYYTIEQLAELGWLPPEKVIELVTTIHQLKEQITTLHRQRDDRLQQFAELGRTISVLEIKMTILQSRLYR